MAVLCIDYGYKLANSPNDLTRHQINFLMSALVNRMEKVAMAKDSGSGVTKFIFIDDEEEGKEEDEE